MEIVEYKFSPRRLRQARAAFGACLLSCSCLAWAAAAPEVGYEVLHSFGAFDGDGTGPYAGVILANDGNFYGTTERGGIYTNGDFGGGTIYRIQPSGALDIVHAFSSTERRSPHGDLLQALDGNLYGLSKERIDGYGDGAVYRVALDGSFKELHVFKPAKEGFNVDGGLVQGPDGRLYGTARQGGSKKDDGTDFVVSLKGRLDVLHKFNPQQRTPAGGLTLAADGNFYGVSVAGGPHQIGIVYRLSPAGKFNTIYSFSGTVDGAQPMSRLVLVNGDLFGTCNFGGAGGRGTVFRITLAGDFKLLHSFGLGTDGLLPQGGLVYDPSDGFLYGTTSNGGAHSRGIVFRIRPEGDGYEAVHAFAGEPQDGKGPLGDLFWSPDGAIYGTTHEGGANDAGTVFRLTP